MKNELEFTSRQTKLQTALVLLYLPFHVLFIPRLLNMFVPASANLAIFNFICYSIGGVYMVLTQWSFLKRDFYTLCDNISRTLVEVGISYGLMLCFNFFIALGLTLMNSATNPNNAAVMDFSVQNSRATAAMAIYIAPIVEELIFRAGIFGFLRRYNRTAAYLFSIIAFSVYHVWSFAIADPTNWIYIIQYIPVTILLCRCYERTNSIWGSIFFHMLVNGMAIRALNALQSMM